MYVSIFFYREIASTVCKKRGASSINLPSSKRRDIEGETNAVLDSRLNKCLSITNY